MASHLSQDDVARLLKEPSPHVRAEIAGKLAQEIDSPRLTESEYGLAQEIVRLMAKDIETTVRLALAQSLRHAVRLPHDVAVQLAHDVETVALPILEHSTVLTDEDLVAIIDKGPPLKHEAIANRTNVSAEVSDALITKADEKAVTVLMNNITAQITEQSLGKAITRFQASDSVKEAMVKRATLPITVAERLTALVSDKLKDYLMAHHDLSPSVAADLVLQGREQSVVGLAPGRSEKDIEKLVAQMYDNNRLTPSIVLRALCMGEVTFFESALAIMANVPLLNARILIHDGGILGLKTLYEKAGMPPGLLSIVRAALDIVHETELDGEHGDITRYRARVIERVLTRFEDTSSEDIDYLLAKLGDIMAAAEVRVN
ncbi:MAG: DUF2336 domain-containing protein [Alphaproteobacteria bacterium]|nr:DUF2336 domain-containing protein [Alphaproteobacteria bacterium]